MKNIIKFILVYLLISCNHSDSTKTKSNLVTDTSISNASENNVISHPVPDTIIDGSKEKIDIIINRKIDTALFMRVSAEVLKHVKTRNYRKLASFIHPRDGIRFSPYAYVDTGDNIVLSSSQLIQLANKSKRINWGTSWNEKPELLTIDQYFKKFVYDVDFLNAELKSVNKYHSQGTDLNNINEIYPDCTVVEFFFPGFEEKYGGLDFRALRLVFKIENNKPYLVAIVHDQWTP
jgi:hypothetical protein